MRINHQIAYCGCTLAIFVFFTTRVPTVMENWGNMFFPWNLGEYLGNFIWQKLMKNINLQGISLNKGSIWLSLSPCCMHHNKTQYYLLLWMNSRFLTFVILVCMQSYHLCHQLNLIRNILDYENNYEEMMGIAHFDLCRFYFAWLASYNTPVWVVDSQNGCWAVFLKQVCRYNEIYDLYIEGFFWITLII